MPDRPNRTLFGRVVARKDKVSVDKSKFTHRIKCLINSIPITQTELARRIGYRSPNIISQWKSGNTRVPLYMIEPLAEYGGVDPAELMREWHQAYQPKSLPSLERNMGRLDRSSGIGHSA